MTRILKTIERLAASPRGHLSGQRTVNASDIDALVEDWRRLDLAVRGKGMDSYLIDATDPRTVQIAFGGPAGVGKTLLSRHIREVLTRDGFQMLPARPVLGRDDGEDLIKVENVPDTMRKRQEVDPPLPEAPAVRSVWRHTSGRLYRVEEITNRQPDRQDRYPTTVVYRNVRNGEPYTRRLADWHRSMTLAQEADDPDNIVNSDREGTMIEAAMYHGFDATNDDATTFTCTQDQIIALLTAAYAPIKAVHVNADPAVVEKAVEKIKAANPPSVLESGAAAPFPPCPGETIAMTGLGLGERPASINEWINRECDKFEEHGLTPHEAGEIARGAVLHMIADKAALITNLANEVHAANVAAGWWTDLKTGEDLHGKRNVGELLCLVHSELSEAIDGTNAADQVLFALRAALDATWTGVGAGRDQLLAVHQSLSRAMEGHRKSLMDDKLPHRPTFRVEMLDALIRLLDILGSDNREHPAGTIFAEKRAFNAQRADHKPENRRQEGGKGY